ncbi:uncharacterized protein LOC126759372 [Bactrocera neohumeralis]|uniref:uncharacterized protein LOC126759372 n=1 Tax=Bactrocera neohumeralis TaxID=98809 RepID=UPI0021660975|nr:uncharacterized protein LOC126759372 [Bactrocera neohumeralis]
MIRNLSTLVNFYYALSTKEVSQMASSTKTLLRISAFAFWTLITLVIFTTYQMSLQSGKQMGARYNVTAAVTQPHLLMNGSKLKTEDIMKLRQVELPNVPFDLWHRLEAMRLNSSCAHAPSLLELRFHNDFWQVFHNANFTYHLFNAYFDARAHVIQSSTVVRVLAMLNDKEPPKNKIHCQLWYDSDDKPTIVPVVEQHLVWHIKWITDADYFPHLLTCAVPSVTREAVAPRAVSLVMNTCDRATNILRVLYERPAGNETQHGFAICLKGLDYPNADMGPRLVEWLEMQRLLGARKVITYKLVLHPNLERVLEHYVEEGFVEVHPLSMGSEMVSKPLYLHDFLHRSIGNKRVNELVPYNDCFYRNMYKYSYIVTVDIDEVIMPLGNRTTWQQLIDEMEHLRTPNCPEGYASVCVRNVHFPIDSVNFTETSAAPQHMFMLQHVYRQEPEAVGKGAKCFQNSSEALILHNHYNLGALKSCRWRDLEPTMAQLQHYRQLENSETWETKILDESIYRYKDALVNRVEPVLKKLSYLRR